jgi:flagellar secretion chaperone FliS
MTIPSNLHALNQYQRMGVQAQVTDASPHALVQMLLDGALARIAAARGAMAAGETARKGDLIGRAIDMVEGLRTGLDQSRGGDLARNLGALYEYMARRLVEANLHNSDEMLEEVAGLLREIRSGWVAIGGADNPAQRDDAR